MTVGIGIICEAEKAVIVAADRLLTRGDTEFEGDAPKLNEIGPNVVSTYTGNTSDTRYIYEYAGLPRQHVDSISQLAEEILESREKFRRRQVECGITRRLLGIGLEEFGRLAVSNSSPICVDVFQQVLKYDQTELLIAGVDRSGAHLMTIGQRGELPQDHRDCGFSSIGSGGMEAHSAIARGIYSRDSRLPEALLIAFDAKRAAELSKGVGTRTDIAIIRDKSIVMLSNKEVDCIRNLHAETMLKPPNLNAEQRGTLDEMCRLR